MIAFPTDDRATVARLHRPALESLLRSLPAILAGRLPDKSGIRSGFQARIGFSALSLIAEDFEKLGRGGVGAAGYKWARNSPEYLAYGKGPKSSRKGPGRAPGHADQPGSGFLNRGEMKLWRKYYGQTLAFLLRRGTPLESAKPIAAGAAWKKMKAGGARTKLHEFGVKRIDNDQVGVDRGTMRRSLLPGVLADAAGPGATYSRSGDKQIFEQTGDSVAVGTKVPYAIHFHKRRRLWPEVFPAAWWTEILGAAVRGLMRIKLLAERGSL